MRALQAPFVLPLRAPYVRVSRRGAPLGALVWKAPCKGPLLRSLPRRRNFAAILVIAGDSGVAELGDCRCSLRFVDVRYVSSTLDRVVSLVIGLEVFKGRRIFDK